MTKMMRKYKTWLMVVFGVLLMLAFLGGPAINEITQMQRNRVIGKIDGEPIRAGEWGNAVGEVSAFTELAERGLPFFDVGIQDRDPHHWLLLTREAAAAGLVAEPSNGQQYLDAIAPILLQQIMQQDYRLYLQVQMEQDPAKRQAMLDQMRGQIMGMVQQSLASAHLSEEDAGRAIARLMGVHQLQTQYYSAPRVSSRTALIEAKQSLDAATGDAIVIPASKIADQIPAPTPEALQAHFDTYKTVKPGEGEYGIGYLLPPRVKLEYLKLDREGIENAVVLDPVEVRKTYAQDRAKYPGEYIVERPRIEGELRSEKGQSLMREAHSALQREVQKVTRRLEASGRFKTLPPDWEQTRPQLAAIAQAVVDAVRAQSGVTIPTPEVVSKTDDWLTQQELAELDGIGMSQFRQGGLQIPFPQVVFWAKELGGTGPIAVQEDVPVVDTYLEDFQGDRYFFTVLATRAESAPDSVADIHDKAVEDYRNLVAFAQLRGQAPQLAASAAGEGLSKLVEQYKLQPPPPATPPAPGSPPPAEAVKKNVRITREAGGFGDPALQEPKVREAIMAAAGQIDPMLPAEQIPASAATVAVPAPKNLSVVVFRINRVEPLTVEMVRSDQTDAQITNHVLSEQMRERTREAFTLASLLKRHTYYNGEKRIETPDQLKGEEG